MRRVSWVFRALSARPAGVEAVARGISLKASIRLGKIAGIEIGLHYSWFVVLALVSWSLATNLLPGRYPGWTTSAYWTTGFLAAFLLFASVLVHEMAHSLVARALGFEVGGITLFILGGVSSLKADSGRARDELMISAVGPLTSVVIAGIFGLLSIPLSDSTTQVAAVVWYLGLINLLLALFNLLPAFPLDGGRMLRASVWGITGNHLKATRIATLGGQVLGIGLMALGAYQFISGNYFGGIWFAFIGWFLQNAAGQSQTQTAVESGLRGVRVRDVMDLSPATVDPNATIAEAVFGHFLRAGARSMPVCDGDILLGIISLTDVRRLPRDRWEILTVRHQMTPIPLKVIGPDDDLSLALDVLAEHAIHQLPVMEEGRLAGLLTRAHVIRYLHSIRELGIR